MAGRNLELSYSLCASLQSLIQSSVPIVLLCGISQFFTCWYIIVLSLKPTENVFCRYWVAVSFWLTGCVSTLIPKDMLALQFCFSSLAPWLTYCCCSCSLFCCFCGRDSSNQHILTASTWLCSSEKKQSQKLCSTAPLKTTKLQAVPFSAPEKSLLKDI